MIPYYTFPNISLGPITIHVWGFFVALGFLLGAFVAEKLARHRKLKSHLIYDVLGWIILGSVIFARIFHVVFYEPAYYFSHLLKIFVLWDGGMSFYGGLFGAILAGVIFLKIKKVSLLDYADAFVFGLPLGLGIGRIGCFLIHDHPGIETKFLLGVRYPDTVIRHDLGLYEVILNLVIFGLFYLVLKKKWDKPGIFIVIFSVVYGLIRFFFDELRILDTTYLGFTPSQYLSVILMIFGVIIYLKKIHRKSC